MTFSRTLGGRGSHAHTATAAILYTYLELVEPAEGRSVSMYHLQNPVTGLAHIRVLVAQSVERPPGVRKVKGSNSIGDRCNTWITFI